jgi:hypothetical protein
MTYCSVGVKFDDICQYSNHHAYLVNCNNFKVRSKSFVAIDSYNFKLEPEQNEATGLQQEEKNCLRTETKESAVSRRRLFTN